MKAGLAARATETCHSRRKRLVGIQFAVVTGGQHGQFLGFPPTNRDGDPRASWLLVRNRDVTARPCGDTDDPRFRLERRIAMRRSVGATRCSLSFRSSDTLPGHGKPKAPARPPMTLDNMREPRGAQPHRRVGSGSTGFRRPQSVGPRNARSRWRQRADGAAAPQPQIHLHIRKHRHYRATDLDLGCDSVGVCMKQRHEPRPPMDLANMYEQGVHHLIAYCRNDACRHQTMRAAHQSGTRPGRLPPNTYFNMTCARACQF